MCVQRFPQSKNCEYIVDQNYALNYRLCFGIGTELGLVNNTYHWLNFKSLGGLY